jgi:hypothetical protein
METGQLLSNGRDVFVSAAQGAEEDIPDCSMRYECETVCTLQNWTNRSLP